MGRDQTSPGPRSRRSPQVEDRHLSVGIDHRYPGHCQHRRSRGLRVRPAAIGIRDLTENGRTWTPRVIPARGSPRAQPQLNAPTRGGPTRCVGPTTAAHANGWMITSVAYAPWASSFHEGRAVGETLGPRAVVENRPRPRRHHTSTRALGRVWTNIAAEPPLRSVLRRIQGGRANPASTPRAGSCTHQRWDGRQHMRRRRRLVPTATGQGASRSAYNVYRSLQARRTVAMSARHRNGKPPTKC